MTDPIGSDPLDALRAADPAAIDELSSASLARVRARVQEIPVIDTPVTTWPLRRTPRLRLLAGAGAGIAALGLALVFALGAGPAVAPGTGEVPGSAQCVDPYSPASLPNRDRAFIGTVTAISGDDVTFSVERWFAGGDAGSVTLSAMGMTGAAITSAGGPTFATGGRYLVAGDGGFAWGCGYSQPYDAGVAASWAAAFGG